MLICSNINQDARRALTDTGIQYYCDITENTNQVAIALFSKTTANLIKSKINICQTVDVNLF